MSFDRAGKAFTNERKYPFIVEVPVAANGLEVELSRQISGFHKSHRIPPLFGRTVFRDGQSYSELPNGSPFRQDFLQLEKRWLELARSIEFGEQLDSFTKNSPKPNIKPNVSW